MSEDTIMLNLQKNKIQRIYKLFDKNPIVSQPKMTKVRIYSGESALMNKDNMIYRDNENKFLAVTWNTVREKPEFSRGVSFYFPDEKIKVSALFKDERFIKYYCEVVETKYIYESDTYIFTDLIVDVNLFDDGRIEVLDEDELKTALESGKVTYSENECILKVKGNILDKIYRGQLLPDSFIEKVESK